MTSSTPLSLLLFLGSARDSSPPSPPRLGLRVARALLQRMAAAGHDAQLIDPLDIPLGPVFRPHFSFRKDDAPPALDALAQRISAADGFVMLSPEYNHSLSPALAHLLNHFGASRFAFKPSAIATYSAGQWGGARAAIAMRAFLSELGCLPVSAMIHVPRAQEVFAEDGAISPGADAASWDNYFDRTLQQLIWWANAARHARGAGPVATRPFQRDPSQRNAPSGPPA